MCGGGNQRCTKRDEQTTQQKMEYRTKASDKHATGNNTARNQIGDNTTEPKVSNQQQVEPVRAAESKVLHRYPFRKVQIDHE